MKRKKFKHRLCYWLSVLGFCFVLFNFLVGITFDALCESRS